MCLWEGRSTDSLAMECDATYQRKLRQKRLQQQFREQMEKKQQQVPGVTPSSKQGEQWLSNLALSITAARERAGTGYPQCRSLASFMCCCAVPSTHL